jgi:restriction system protein
MCNRAETAPIDLIDGDELIDKSRELQLGVIPVTDYFIDETWFSSL